MTVIKRNLIELKDTMRPGTTRGLDFVIVDELRKRTGITPGQALKFALGEMLCNSLDKDDATKIDVDVRQAGKFRRLKVSDNGSKHFTKHEIEMILDFENKASSKRGFHWVSRGYLGNALKCVCGYSYALAEDAGLSPPEIVVRSGGVEYKITLVPNRVKGRIEHRIVTTDRRDDGRTTFTVRFPKDGQNIQGMSELIFATSMVNPTRKITYDIDGKRGTLGSAEGGKALRRETSVLWYTEKQFRALFEDYCRAEPKRQLKEFIALFRGFRRFSEQKTVCDKLQKLMRYNHDYTGNGNVQFVTTTPIGDLLLSAPAVSRLFKVMKAEAKPVSKRSVKSVLGFVGKEQFERVREQLGWEKLRYVCIPTFRVECPDKYLHDPDVPCTNPDHVRFPYLVEIAAFDRKNDGRGLEVYQCVNFMASTEDVFSRIFNVGYRLGRVGITEETPVTVIAHLVCPVLKWLNYGKGDLGE
jgi:hypothetical protein